MRGIRRRRSGESLSLRFPANAAHSVIPAKVPHTVIPAKVPHTVIPAKAGIHFDFVFCVVGALDENRPNAPSVTRGKQRQIGFRPSPE
ncbi:MAG: hypothetical protein ABW186_02950 [Rhodanobacteraceae bacterium]